MQSHSLFLNRPASCALHRAPQYERATRSLGHRWKTAATSSGEDSVAEKTQEERAADGAAPKNAARNKEVSELILVNQTCIILSTVRQEFH